MANDFERPHLRIDRFASRLDYRGKGIGGGKDYGRAFDQHAESLKRDAATAWADADSLLGHRAEAVGAPGAYLAFETAPGANLPDLEWK